MGTSDESKLLRFRDAPAERVLIELYCLRRAIMPHAENNITRTGATLVIVLAWGAIEVGAAFGHADLPSQFFALRLVVGLVIGRMWGIEINNVAGVEIDYGTRDGGDSDGDEK